MPAQTFWRTRMLDRFPPSSSNQPESCLLTKSFELSRCLEDLHHDLNVARNSEISWPLSRGRVVNLGYRERTHGQRRGWQQKANDGRTGRHLLDHRRFADQPYI